MDLTVGVGTDAATICFFHPDDLTAYADAPLTWYATSYAVVTEFEQGHLIAFGTGNDGGFSVRVTDEGLSDRERTYAGASCEFRLNVTSGRLTIDNTDGLPSEEQQDDRTTRDAGWFDIANGAYRATVTAIRWADEPGAVGDNGRSTPEALTSYVLSLEPVSDLSQVRYPTGLPGVLPDQTEPTFTLDFADEPGLDMEPSLESAPLHIIVSGERLSAPGHRLTVPLLERPPNVLRSTDLIVANDQRPGSIGVYSQFQTTGGDETGWDFVVKVLAPVRIVEVVEDPEWPLCDFEAIAVTNEPIGADLRNRLLDAFAQHARAWHLYAAEFQIARMRSKESDRALTNALIGLLNIEPAQTAWLLAANDRERAEALLTQLSP